jgi:hypothetical protein
MHTRIYTQFHTSYPQQGNERRKTNLEIKGLQKGKKYNKNIQPT